MTGDHESTVRGAGLTRLPTSVDGLELRALHELDASAYHSLVRRNAEHLTRFGDYTDEVAATAQEHLRERSSAGAGRVQLHRVRSKVLLPTGARPGSFRAHWCQTGLLPRPLVPDRAPPAPLVPDRASKAGNTPVWHHSTLPAFRRTAQRFEDYTRYHLHLGVGA